jgi:Ni/Fe-hydrogenase subunit HybB-like protein
VYFPTWVEWSITLASLAVFMLLYVAFARIFPIVSIWEVREGEHELVPAADESAAAELAM